MEREVEQIMKRCQVGTRNYDEANNLHAACYGLIGKLSAQRQWVGLTDEDCKDMSAGDKVVAMWANRILKEKNT